MEEQCVIAVFDLSKEIMGGISLFINCTRAMGVVLLKATIRYCGLIPTTKCALRCRFNFQFGHMAVKKLIGTGCGVDLMFS
jgi:hypothetical protein